MCRTVTAVSSEEVTDSHTAVRTWQLPWHAWKLPNSLNAPHVQRCRQSHCPFSRGLLELLSGAISDPFPDPPKGVPRCRILTITASSSRLYAASPSDAPPRGTSSASALDKARVACVVLRVLMRSHPRKDCLFQIKF